MTLSVPFCLLSFTCKCPKDHKDLQPSFPYSDSYPCLQQQQTFPENKPAEQARKTGKITNDLLHFLLLSKTSPPVTSLDLQQNTFCSLPPCFVHISSEFRRPSLPSIAFFQPQLQQALPATPQTTPTKKAGRLPIDLPSPSHLLDPTLQPHAPAL